MGKTVAIIGGGTMGSGIALGFGAAGWATHVVARSEKTRAQLRERWTIDVKALDAPASCIDGIRLHASMDALPWGEVDLFIETVTEDLALKQRLFAEMESKAKPGAIFTSNSSSYPISQIAATMRDRTRVAGAHYFSPAHIVPLVEVVACATTAPEVMDTLMADFLAAGKMPVRVNRDVPGFLANRLQHALMRECYHVISAGIAGPDEVDLAVRFSFGFRFLAAGPILQKDLSGLDVSYSAGCVIYPDLCNDPKPAPCIEDLVAAGNIGVKTKQGFWTWTDESIAAERARYNATLQKALKVLLDDAKAKGRKA